MGADRGPTALLTWLLLVASLQVITCESADSEYSCPLEYARLSLEEIARGQKRPYLFGGIYETSSLGRPCARCNDGSLWSAYCGRRKVGNWHWDQQCSKEVVQSTIRNALRMSDTGVLTLSPCDLYQLTRGRTIWIIGDSMSDDLYRAVKCFMVEFVEPKQHHPTKNYSALHYLDDLPGRGRPKCAHLHGNGRVCFVHVVVGDLLTRDNIPVLPIIHSIGHPDDVFITNFGLWHPDTPAHMKRYHSKLHKLGELYNQTKSVYRWQFFMQTPKQHFDSDDGDFKEAWKAHPERSRGPFVCKPIRGVLISPQGTLLAADPDDKLAQYVVAGTWRNIQVQQVLHGVYGMPLLPIYNTTVAAWGSHRQNRHGQECSHYCHPSIPQLWVYTLYKTLRDAGVRSMPAAEAETKVMDKGCGTVTEWYEEEYDRQAWPAQHSLESKIT